VNRVEVFGSTVIAPARPTTGVRNSGSAARPISSATEVVLVPPIRQ
jgi:hypothetical protein